MKFLTEILAIQNGEKGIWKKDMSKVSKPVNLFDRGRIAAFIQNVMREYIYVIKLSKALYNKVLDIVRQHKIEVIYIRDDILGSFE